MKVEERIQLLKFFLMVFNGVFVIIGLAVFGCGIWILFDKSSFVVTISGVRRNASLAVNNGSLATGQPGSKDFCHFYSGQMRLVAGGLFVIGLIVVGVSILGYIAASKEIRFLIILYMSLLIVIFICQLFVTFVLLLGRGEILTALVEEVDDIIVAYGTEDPNTSASLWDVLDSVQHYSECCGRTNYTQWENNTFIKLLPDNENVYPCSCFKSSCPRINNDTAQRFGMGSAIYTEACEESIEAWLRENSYAILGMDAGLVIIQVLQFFLSLYLYKSIKRKVKQGELLSEPGDLSASNSAYTHLD